MANQQFAIITIREPQPRRMLGLLAPPPPAERRVLANPSIQASLDRIASSMPSDVAAFEANIGYRQGEGVAGVVYYKTPGGWSVMGGVFYNEGDFGGQVGVRKVWRKS